MGTVGGWLRRLVRLPETSHAAVDEAALTLRVIMLGGSCVLAALTLAAPFLMQTPGPAMSGYIAMLVVHLIALDQLSRGRTRVTAMGLCLSLFVLVSLNAYRHGGLSGIGVFVYPTIVVLAGVTWSTWAAFGFAAAASLTALLMGVYEPSLLFEPLPPPTAIRTWATLTAVVTISSVMLGLAARSMALARRREQELREQLVAAQKFEALGRLAGGVAHDFNNLLTVILLHTSFLKQERQEVESANSIESAALRAAEMTQQLLALSRRQSVLARVVDVNQSLRDTLKLVTTLLPPTVELKASYGQDVGRTKMDPSGLERVVINLVLNARDAMTDGGEIRVSTESCTIDFTANNTLTPGRYTRLVVQDNGPGISSAIRDRLFEPFASTKGGKGSGLGLASAHGVVVQSGGSITVDNAPGGGARFEVLLPTTDATDAIEAIVTRQPLSPRPEAVRVLLLDDDTGLRTTTRRMLESSGYTVQEHGALAEIPEPDLQAADVLLTDAIDNDPESLRALREHHPKLRVALVRKPFTRDQLLTSVQHALG